MENTHENTILNKKELLEKSIETINTLFLKYEKNEYVLNRLNNHISSLSSIIENELFNYEKRIDRNNYLCNNHFFGLKFH